MNPLDMKPFPIPVVSLLGPGSQDDDAPAYLPMPQGMSTYQPPPLPEPEALAAHPGCLRVLHDVLAALQRAPGERAAVVDLDGLVDEERRLLNELLGEGEVSAQVLGEDGVRVQESVFAGVWPVVKALFAEPAEAWTLEQRAPVAAAAPEPTA